MTSMDRLFIGRILDITETNMKALTIILIALIIASCRPGNALYKSDPKSFKQYNQKVGR